MRAQLAILVLVSGTVALAGSSAGCAKAQAKTSPDGPPLDMPAPPPRVIAPLEEPIATVPAEVADPAPAPPSTPRRPVRRPATTTEPATKPDAVAPPTEPAPEVAIEARPAEPQPTLQAPGSAEKPVRDRLAGAQRDLARVDYARLSAGGRAQYEQSKRFAQQADQALKDQNFVFAQTLAEKAALLAAELSGR